MIPYYLLITVILLLQLKFKKGSTNQAGYKIAFIALFSFAALRGNGDGDYFSYLSFSKLVNSIEDVIYASIPMEVGFRLISYLANIIGAHPQLVIAIMNLISLTCIFIFIKKYSSDKLLSVLLFLPLYFQFDMHAARTAVAIGLGTIGLKYIFNNKLIKFLLVVLLAASFHKSALILILIYFIRNIRFNFNINIIFMGLLIIATELISIDKIVLSLLNIAGQDDLFNRYLVYSQSLEFGFPFKLYDPRFILLIVILVCVKFVIRNPGRFENLLINFLWMNIFIMIIFREHTALVTRLSSFFNIYTIILIPKILYELKSVNKKSLNYKMFNSYHLTKMATIYIYILYIISLLYGTVEYKLYFMP